MKNRLFTALAALLLAVAVGAARTQETGLGKYRGVWAGMKSEAVFTDSVMMYFHRDTLSGTGYGALRVPSRGIDMLTTFSKDTITFGKTPDYRIHATPDGALCIGGDTLKKIESIDITQPYDMPQAATRLDIGRCLQEWQLGTVIETSGKDVLVMVGTNRNSFMYNIGGGMVYLRAAAMLQCNEGRRLAVHPKHTHDEEPEHRRTLEHLFLRQPRVPDKPAGYRHLEVQPYALCLRR